MLVNFLLFSPSCWKPHTGFFCFHLVHTHLKIPSDTCFCWCFSTWHSLISFAEVQVNKSVCFSFAYRMRTELHEIHLQNNFHCMSSDKRRIKMSEQWAWLIKGVEELDRASKHVNLCVFVTKVEYKKGLGNNSGYSINYCDTPQFKSVSKISKYTSDVSFQCLLWSV